MYEQGMDAIDTSNVTYWFRIQEVPRQCSLPWQNTLSLRINKQLLG